MNLERFFIIFGNDYAKTISNWVKSYFNGVNYDLLTDTSFQLWSIALEGGLDCVKSKYKELSSKYINEYKLFTDFVLQVNMLSWAHDKLRDEGFADREEWIDLYSDLYYEARDLFYDTFGNNNEACDYYFEKTD